MSTCMTPNCRRAGRNASPGSQWCQTCAGAIARTIIDGYQRHIEAGMDPTDARAEVAR